MFGVRAPASPAQPDLEKGSAEYTPARRYIRTGHLKSTDPDSLGWMYSPRRASPAARMFGVRAPASPAQPVWGEVRKGGETPLRVSLADHRKCPLDVAQKSQSPRPVVRIGREWLLVRRRELREHALLDFLEHRSRGGLLPHGLDHV